MHVSQRFGWGYYPRRARRATPDWTVGYLHTLFLAMASLCYADLLSQADAQIAIPPGVMSARRRAALGTGLASIARRPSHSLRVQPFSLTRASSSCELPVGFGVVLVLVALPGGHFFVEGLLVGDGAN